MGLLRRVAPRNNNLLIAFVLEWSIERGKKRGSLLQAACRIFAHLILSFKAVLS
jgi:hypothetical protein